MPRRPRVRHYIAPLTSLALISSMLIALSALLPGGAAAKRSTEASSTEAPALAAPAPAAGKSEANAAAKATKAAERAARRAERDAGAPEAGSEASGAAAPGGGSAAKPAHGHDAAAAARRAERRAEHEARRNGGAQPAGRAGALAKGAAPAAKTTKTEREQAHEQRLEREREKERAREKRRREREGKHHETRKEREAREAEEAAEDGPALGGAAGGGAQAATAAVGVSNIAGGSPTAQAPSIAAVASSRTGRPTRSRRAARARRARTAAQSPETAATALGLAPVASQSSGAGAGGSNGNEGTGQHKHHGTQRESPLVKTVTRIIGVIPTALWLLIAALALAAAAFAVASRVAARRARRFDRQRRELLEDVGLLQAALLPELPDRLGPVATAAAYRPASGPGAGGDFYDVFALPEGLLAVIVGDVSGHGREALPHTTLLRYTLRAYLEAGLSPRETLRSAAPALERQLGGSFATVVLATYDPRARLLTYSAAGHPHPILTGLDPDASIIAASAPPIGAGRPTGTRQTVVSVPGASTALFYTDGVIEARTDGELYGQRRLAAALGSLGGAATGGSGAPSEAEALLDRVAEQTDKRPDDMAAVLLELAGTGAAPRITGEELVVDAREANGKRPQRFLRAAGLDEAEIAGTIEKARAMAAESGAALLKVVPGGERPQVFVEHDNIAPLRARALARTQEVAL